MRGAQKQVFKVRADAVQFLFEVRELFGDAGGFGHQRRSVLTRLLRHADLLGERVALRLELFGAGLHGLALRLEAVELLFGELETAGGESGHHFRKLLAQHRHVEHL